MTKQAAKVVKAAEPSPKVTEAFALQVARACINDTLKAFGQEGFQASDKILAEMQMEFNKARKEKKDV